MRFTFLKSVQTQVNQRLQRAKKEFEANGVPIEIKYVDKDPLDNEYVFEVHPEDTAKNIAKFLREMNLSEPYNGCIRIEPQGDTTQNGSEGNKEPAKQQAPPPEKVPVPVPTAPEKKIATTRESISKLIKEQMRYVISNHFRSAK